MVRFNIQSVTDMSAPPMTAAIIPAKLPKKTAMRNNDEPKSIAISKYRTFLISNFSRRKMMANAEKIPAKMWKSICLTPPVVAIKL